MAKKKEMNRTAGTARRKISQAEQVRYGMKTGAPLTGSASGVKSISLKQAGEVLTQGIVSARGKKLSFDPVGLAMALPVGKVAGAAKALRAAGNIERATALEARLGAKVAGSLRRGNLAERSGRTPVSELSKGTFEMGQRARRTSESVFPRLPSANLPPGSARTFDIYADPLEQGAYRFQGGVVRKASGAYGEATMPRVGSKLPKPKLPKGRGK